MYFQAFAIIVLCIMQVFAVENYFNSYDFYTIIAELVGKLGHVGAQYFDDSVYCQGNLY